MRVRLATCSVLLFLPLSAGAAAAPAAFARTTEALQQRLVDEITAHQKYNAYAEQACREGFPNISHLFRGLAASEAIHARNFRRLLASLGADARNPPPLDSSAVAGTRHNLSHAAEVERDEIDREYPAIIERIEPEQHEAAIAGVTHAWKAEQQHRDLIVKLQKSVMRWFGLVVKRIEGEASHIHVCDVCGSTLQELPEAGCPICGQPVSNYREVEPFPEEACPDTEQLSGGTDLQLLQRVVADGNAAQPPFVAGRPRGVPSVQRARCRRVGASGDDARRGRRWRARCRVQAGRPTVLASLQAIVPAPPSGVPRA
jgi:rubrerythrin